MPERGFDTGYWSDPFIQTLPKEGKYLYAYLWTNPHCNPAGLYEITLKTIAFETDLDEQAIPNLLDLLGPKVKWYPEANLVWVKNFIKRQAKSSKFLAAAAKCLISIHNNGVVMELLEYNREKYSISIPYQYYIDIVAIPSASASVSSTVTNAKAERGEEKRGVGGREGEGLLPDEKDIIACLRQLEGWQADEDDGLWLQGVVIQIPGLTLADFKACVDYYSGRPLPKHKGIWKNRFRNWMIKKQEFERKGGLVSQKQGVGGGADKYIGGKYGHMVNR